MSRFFVRAIDEGYIEKKRLMIDGIKTVCIKLLHSPIQKEEQEGKVIVGLSTYHGSNLVSLK